MELQAAIKELRELIRELNEDRKAEIEQLRDRVAELKRQVRVLNGMHDGDGK